MRILFAAFLLFLAGCATTGGEPVPVEMEEPVTSQELKGLLGCRSLLRYDRVNGLFREAGGEDFPIEAGEGYLVRMPEAREKVLFSGSPRSSAVPVMMGMNLTGLPWNPSGYDSFHVVSELSINGNRASLQRFNASTGLFETASIMEGQPVGVRFPIRAGEAYFLLSEQDMGLWWPSFF